MAAAGRLPPAPLAPHTGQCVDSHWPLPSTCPPSPCLGNAALGSRPFLSLPGPSEPRTVGPTAVQTAGGVRGAAWSAFRAGAGGRPAGLGRKEGQGEVVTLPSEQASLQGLQCFLFTWAPSRPSASAALGPAKPSRPAELTAPKPWATASLALRLVLSAAGGAREGSSAPVLWAEELSLPGIRTIWARPGALPPPLSRQGVPLLAETPSRCWPPGSKGSFLCPRKGP